MKKGAADDRTGRCNPAILVLAVAAWLSTPIVACGEPPTKAGSAAPQGSVWMVDSPDTGGRLYLCGTIHVLRSADYPLASAYETAYADSTRLLFELPPGSSGGSALSTRIQELGMLPPEQKLQDMVDKSTWERMEVWAASRKTPASRFSRYRPWFAAITIAAVEYAVLGAEPDRGVDTHFEERAAKDGKPGEGLETVDFQLNLFANLTAAQQEDLLRQTLAEVKSLPEEFKKMIDAWKEGDLETLRQMLYHEAERYPDLMDLFLHDRNQAWLAKFEECLRKGEHVMVLVGTGHLAGEKGVIALLRKRGHTVARCAGETPPAARR